MTSMQISPTVALLKAIRARLKTNGIHIYDEVPRGTPLPYLAFTKMQSKDWSTNTGRGVEQWVHIECWSGQPGLQECFEMGERLTHMLEDQPLFLLGWDAVALRVMNAETSREQQGRLARLVLKIRVFLEEKES